MSDDITFSGTSSSPPANTRVATDYKPFAGGSAHVQRMALDIGPDGTSVPLAWGGTGMPLGTLPGGTVQAHGTTQILGTVRALDGGTVQVHGTLQALGTYQPLAGSVHLASSLPGTAQVLGSVRVLDPVQAAQSGAWSVEATGTVQPLAGSVHLASGLPGTAQVLGSVRILDPAAVTQSGAWAVSVTGTAQALGTVQPLAGSVHLASPLPGTAQVLGTVQPHGTGQILGTVRALVDAGTVQALGTVQPLAGSVHLANAVTGTVVAYPGTTAAGTFLAVRLTDGANFYTASGGAGGGFSVIDEAPYTAAGSYMVPIGGFVTADAVPDGSVGAVAMTGARALHVAPQGTTQALGTVQTHGTSQVLGSVRSVGTTEVLGTVQPLAGSVHIASTPPGTTQIIGTVQPHGTIQALGTVRALIDAGTAQVLGTVQTHGTTQTLGTIAAAGQVAHGAAAAGAPLLMAAFGSSGTQAAVDDGDVTRLWADLNGRLQVVGSVTATAGGGTYQVLGSVQTHGTTQVLGSVRSVGTTEALGTYQPLAGSVHVANTISGTVQTHGTSQVLGTVRIVDPAAVSQSGAWSVSVTGTAQVLGSVRSVGTTEVLGTTQPLAGSVHLASFLPGGTVQTHGTSQALGTVQPLAGSVHPAAALPGTSQVSGTVQVARLTGEGRFGTVFTGAVTNGTLVPAPAQGTYVRVWDLLISGSAAGTAWVELGDGTRGPGIFAAANGGLSFNSARGYRTNGTSEDVLFNCSAGSWSVFVAWSVET